MGSAKFWCLLSLLVLEHSVQCLRLNDFVSHFEPLTFDLAGIQKGHGRVKRWIREPGQIGSEPTIRFGFDAHGVRFNVTLRRDLSVFGEHFELEFGDKDTEPFVQNLHLFEGVLEDVPGSRVYGSIRNGVFDGKIATPTETFYIENSRKFNLENNTAHAVIYKESDIDLTAVFGQNKNTNDTGSLPCGASEDVHQWMRRIQNSQIPSEPQIGTVAKFSFSQIHRSMKEPEHGSHSTYSLAREFLHRTKRQSPAAAAQDEDAKILLRTTCSLHIRTDPMLWRYIAKQEGMDHALISEEILSIIGQHVKGANEIFANSRFEGDKTPHKNIQFLVRRVKIDTDEKCGPDYTGIPNPFCVENLDVSNFLDLHSRFNHDDFCLSYTFTYRDFSGGVVGLAWVASPDNSGAAGGICEKFSSFSDFTSKRSLNTGIVTFLNYNRRLPLRVSQLTFTHELGHNFGSPHDPEVDCQPGGKLGNYLMYSSSTSGYLHNNDKFSSCSIKSIGLVLDRVLSNPTSKTNCFEATDSTFCGNQIVEEGEECDCGYNNEECVDRCCIPRVTLPPDTHMDISPPTKSHLNPHACKRTKGSECSPSEGPCCETDCTFSPRSQHQLKPCQIETECTVATFCSGTSPHCPTPEPKPNNETLCNNGTQVCIDGVCRGSLCMKYGYEECYLEHEQHSNKTVLCELACLNKKGKCVPISNVTNLNQILQLPPGTPCDNFRGFCDVFHRCRAVDQKGPLLRLTKILFNHGTYNNAIDWIKGNPWWTGLILLGFLVLMGLFVKCCAVHTPSHNPNLPQHLKFSETLQRPIKTLQRRKASGAGAPQQPAVAYEMGPRRGRRKESERPLPSERASMVPYH